jgi:AraC-like DNA-binding protein
MLPSRFPRQELQLNEFRGSITRLWHLLPTAPQTTCALFPFGLPRVHWSKEAQQLRRDLAVRYLDDPKLHVSKIAWLLGFRQVSAFTHAFRRWTGKTPSQMRVAGAY